MAVAASVGVLSTAAASTAGAGCSKVPHLERLSITKAIAKSESAHCGVPVDQPFWIGDNKTAPACRKASRAGHVIGQVPAPGSRLKRGRILLSTCPLVVTGKPKVHVVYAVPAGAAWNTDDETAIAGAASSLQTWYLGQVGKTFSIASSQPLLCRLPYPASEYRSNTWDKLYADLQPCANLTAGSKRADWVVYAAVDHTCNKPGPIGEGEAGLTFLGVQDLNGLIGAPVRECGQSFDEPTTRYIGGLGHEMGHTFGLPHPPGCDKGLSSCDANAIMWQGYADYPNTYLRQDEIAPLRKSPYFWKTSADGR